MTVLTYKSKDLYFFPHSSSSGSVSSNVSEKYANLASALQWVNFQMDVPGAAGGGDTTTTLEAKVQAQAAAGARRLTTTAQEVLAREAAYKVRP